MKLGIHLSDYNIHSAKIFRVTLFAFCAILFSILLAETFVGLRSTSLEILIPLNVLSVGLILLYRLYPDLTWLRMILVILVYGVVETHFLYNPRTFHVICYWLPIVPIAALIVAGIRASQLWMVIILVTHLFNGIYVRQTQGGTYQVIVEDVPFFIAGSIFTISILSACFLLYNMLAQAYSDMKSKNQELDLLKYQMSTKNDLLQRYQRQLVHLSKNELFQAQERNFFFRAICQSAANSLPVSRVSIWFLKDHNNKLTRQYLVDADKVSYECVVLERSDFPHYFNALESKPFIMAPHAREHPDTIEFTDPYLKPLEIYSMLDCPIIVDQKTIGVICCENQKSVKDFNSEDALFVQSLADFVSISYKNERIKNLLEQVNTQNQELTERNVEIKFVNEELASVNDTLKAVNNNLEDTVKKRTQELEAQNKQLTEYAFINSHLLRAPLSRILGLSQLISKEVTSVKEQELVDALTRSTNEMDSIIRKISELLYEGNTLTRKDIQEIVNRNFGKKD